MDEPTMKRRVIVTAMLGGTAALLAGHLSPERVHAEEAEITPLEDLMREHGVLARMLLIYDACEHRLSTEADPLPAGVLGQTVDLVRRFVEDYHERIEEEHVFPRLERTGRLVDLVAVLRLQHRRGRELTDRIRKLAAAREIHDRARRNELVGALRSFGSMYRPHAAREDTVLFPAVRGVVPEDEYRTLGERFEDEEHRQFGPNGFVEVVASIASLERQLDIHALERFTPAASGAPSRD